MRSGKPEFGVRAARDKRPTLDRACAARVPAVDSSRSSVAIGGTLLDPYLRRPVNRANLLREFCRSSEWRGWAFAAKCGRYEDVGVFAKHEERAMNKDQVKGSAKRVKGKVQEMAGKAIGNKNLEARGDANQAAGRTQRAYGDAKQMAKKSSK
jgi:uncharacterized protein YjbJ (UPF0337 family)